MAGWHTRAIIYQIDTALFYDLKGDGCGDIAGITAKLRYIRRMGATVIWITPFYLTPFLDEGYDVSDHLQVDPRFGKLADIIAFIEQARELGMQVIIELLIQHTSDAHPGFRRPGATRNPPFATIICGQIMTMTIRLRCSPAWKRASGHGTTRRANTTDICFIATSLISTSPHLR